MLSLLLATVAWLACPFPTQAHRLDEYLQATFAVIEPGSVKLQMILTPGVAVAAQVLEKIGGNNDDVVSSQEAAAYADLLKRDLTVRLDGVEMALKFTSSAFPTLSELRNGLGYIQVEFTLQQPQVITVGPHKLSLENRHFKEVGAYLINASQPKSERLQILRQQRNDNQSAGEIEFALSKE